MVFAVKVAAECGVLESVFAFRRMDVGMRGTVEANSCPFDNVGVSGFSLEKGLIGGFE